MENSYVDTKFLGRHIAFPGTSDGHGKLLTLAERIISLYDDSSFAVRLVTLPQANTCGGMFFSFIYTASDQKVTPNVFWVACYPGDYIYGASTPIGTLQSIADESHNIAAAYSLEGSSLFVNSKAARVQVESGTNGSGGTVDIKIQECDDNATWVDWATGGFTQITEANDNTVYAKQYTGGLDYVRVVATVGTAACTFGVTIATLHELAAPQETFVVHSDGVYWHVLVRETTP